MMLSKIVSLKGMNNNGLQKEKGERQDALPQEAHLIIITGLLCF